MAALPLTSSPGMSFRNLGSYKRWCWLVTKSTQCGLLPLALKRMAFLLPRRLRATLYPNSPVSSEKWNCY